jgi:hypothetical protein
MPLHSIAKKFAYRFGGSTLYVRVVGKFGIDSGPLVNVAAVASCHPRRRYQKALGGS